MFRRFHENEVRNDIMSRFPDHFKNLEEHEELCMLINLFGEIYLGFPKYVLLLTLETTLRQR